MDISRIRVLLIEDNSGDARLIREILAEVKGALFEIERVDRLSEGLQRMAAGGIDLVLLDLTLPDSIGFNTFSRAHAQDPELPIVVLTGLDDETLAIKSVKAGAQDYLVKGQIDQYLLVRAMRYAVERQRMQTTLRKMSLVDDLTGLYNRRGFYTFAEQYLKMVQRIKKNILIVFADVDGMKKINDTFGHMAGDRALIETADVLRETFRDTDILGRISGDEFAVLAIDADMSSADLFAGRLLQKLAELNAEENRRYNLSISIGIVSHDPEYPCSVDELISRADVLMYEQKRKKEQRS